MSSSDKPGIPAKEGEGRDLIISRSSIGALVLG